MQLVGLSFKLLTCRYVTQKHNYNKGYLLNFMGIKIKNFIILHTNKIRRSTRPATQYAKALRKGECGCQQRQIPGYISQMQYQVKETTKKSSLKQINTGNIWLVVLLTTK